MKMKKMRKGVAAILAIALLITLTPVMALTDDEPDTETLLTNVECVVSSETANTQAAVTNWIKANWLLGISGLDDVLGRDYDVEISDLKMTTPTDPFKAAVDGTVESPEGSAGQLKFSVVVPGADGVGTPQLTVSKTCTITPKGYTAPETPVVPQINVKSPVLSPATVGEPYSFSLDSLLANGFSADLVSWTLPSTTLLPEGLTFTAGEGTISGTPTTTGNYTLSDIQAAATGGQYQASIFSFALTVNEAVQYPTPVILASGETVEVINEKVHVDKGDIVYLKINLPQNAPTHTLQWQVKQESENTFVPLTEATKEELNINSELYPNNTQFRCVATYSGSEVRESFPVTIRHRIAETASVTGTVTTENGTPVAGWNVIATDKNNNLIAEAETGKNGEYRFEALQANENYTLSVEGVTGDNSAPVTTGGQGSQLSKNITLATGNIPGATSANLQTSDGIPVVSEFVPTGNITGDNTLSAESYSPTEQDYIAAIDQVSPGAKKVKGEMVEIPEEDIEVIENFQFQGVDYKIGELVLINHVFYIVKHAVEFSPDRSIHSLRLINMSDGFDYFCDKPMTLPGMRYNDSKYDITYEKGKIIYINGVKYYNNYKAANTVFPTVYTLVRWDGNGVPVEAGVYDIANTGAVKGEPGARFNKGYSPSELPKDIVDEITPVTDTFITRDDKLLEMLVRFSSDLTVTNNESQATDIPGTTSITGLDNIGSNVIAVHKGENGYEVGTAIKNGYSWYGSSRSPFMIFSVNEINTEIPAREIDIESSQKKVSPKTSDNMNMAVWGLLALGSGTCITRTYIKRRKYDR